MRIHGRRADLRRCLGCQHRCFGAALLAVAGRARRRARLLRLVAGSSGPRPAARPRRSFSRQRRRLAAGGAGVRPGSEPAGSRARLRRRRCLDRVRGGPERWPWRLHLAVDQRRVDVDVGRAPQCAEQRHRRAGGV